MKKILTNSKLLSLLFPILFYVLFFFPVMDLNKIIGGPDAVRYSYPARYYLWESIKEGRYPFWTERLFGGYPIYTDSEHAYTSILNILSVVVLGPFNSYKFLHFTFYYIGSISLIFFLKRKGINLISSLSAAVIYYFSFFLLYHQQHLSMTLTAYLMPLGIYLADRIISEKNIYISLILSVLTSLIISFGSYQMVFLFILAIFMYSITQVNFNSLRRYLFIIFVYIFTTFFISLPRLLPTYQSYLRGNRRVNGITHTDGSFNPMMTVNLIYPFIFGYGENYKWNTVSSEYQIHETYIYVGITSAITGFFGYFLIKDSKLRKFINLCVLFFLIFGFINYIPFLNTLKIPIISSFRFWGRSVFLLVFSLSISAAYFINNVGIEKEFSILKNRFIYIISLIFIVQLWFSFYQDKKSSIIIQQVKNRAIQFDTQFNLWLGLFFLTFLSVFLILLIRNKHSVLIKYFLLTLIFTDLFYFGHDIVNKYAKKIDELYSKKTVEISEDYKNQRIVILSKDTEYNFGLYLKSWGVLGYSQYNPNLRSQLTKSIGFKETSKQYESEINLTALDRLGVVKLLSTDGLVIHDFQVNSSLQNFDGIILEEGSLEGEYHFKIKSNSQQKINTFINNHPGWDIKINGSLYKNKNTDVTFLIFEVPFGDVDIEIRFVPKIFYLSLVISFLGLISMYLLIKIRNLHNS